MLTPPTISNILQEINTKHNQYSYGLSPTNQKILKFVTFEINKLNNSDLDELTKINKMLNLLEGFYRFLNQNTKQVLLLDIERLLTFIYYPESEDFTLANKDNLNIGKKSQTVAEWHDSYFENNRAAIYNSLFDCKSILSPKTFNNYQYLTESPLTMPDAMQKKYEEMLNKSPKRSPSRHG